MLVSVYHLCRRKEVPILHAWDEVAGGAAAEVAGETLGLEAGFDDVQRVGENAGHAAWRIKMRNLPATEAQKKYQPKRNLRLAGLMYTLRFSLIITMSEVYGKLISYSTVSLNKY
jgi:hypothetical protein